MPIKLDRPQLIDTIERAVRDARDPNRPVDRTWEGRIRWLGEQMASGDARGKTYMSALGGALLAKSVDGRVDTLTHKESGGERAYSLRRVVELLQARVQGTVHIGADSPNPVNNRPFGGDSPARIHLFTVATYMRQVYLTYVDWMRGLDDSSSDPACAAFVTYCKVRMQAQQDEDRRRAEGTRMISARSTLDLVDALQQWAIEDPERGARGQAVVAAVLDLVWPDVEVVAKHDPAPFDVKRAGDPAPLVVEVKQKAVNETQVLGLAKRAADRDASLALYASLAVDQPQIPTERLRRDALRETGTLLDVVHDIYEMVVSVCVHAGITAETLARKLPQALADRCHAAGVSESGLDRLSMLLRDTGAQIRLDQ